MEALLKLETTNSFTNYGRAPLIVWPNLGKPAILSLSGDQFNGKMPITVEILALMEPTFDSDHLRRNLGRATLTVLLGIDPSTKRAIPGTAIKLEIGTIIQMPLESIDTGASLMNYLNTPTSTRQRGLGCELLHATEVINNAFCGRNAQFRIEARFVIPPMMIQYLQKHTFIMANLTQSWSSLPKHVLLHAFCFSKKPSWENLNFMHVTDLHIAKRNDEILGVLMAKIPGSPMEKITAAVDQTIDDFKDTMVKLKDGFDRKVKPGLDQVKSFLKIPSRAPKPAPESKPESSGDQKDLEPELKDIPLEKRFHNPNNMLRRLNRNANLLAENGSVDFIVMTGDLIDFCMRGDLLDGNPDFDYSSTNWERFVDLLLNNSVHPPMGFNLLGLEPNEELLVPIFTVLGNHDYRVGHYGLEQIGVNRYFGLRPTEALLYRDLNKSPSPLIPSKLALQGYYQHINPFEDFFLKFGEHSLIFLNSGYDTILQPQYLFMGDPSLTGFTDSQMKYLQVLEHKIITPFPTGQLILLSHAPIFNPILRKAFQMGLLQTIRVIPQIKLEDFKESRLRTLGETNTRSDLDLDYHAGVIATNWEQTIAFLDKNKGVALNGHTHKLREFRTQEEILKPNEETGIIAETNYAIYWDDYALLTKGDSAQIEALLPLHLQTPALGLGTRPDLHPGAYRTIKIEANHWKRLDVAFLEK